MSGKLVRDRIPELIRASGLVPVVHVLEGKDFEESLRLKLVEEAIEVQQAKPSDLAEELADVLEVIHTLAETSGIPWPEVEIAADNKRVERGGFTSRLWLEES